LYVHSNRLSSSGDFGLIIIHALSHIKVNADDVSNDGDPKFLAEFYKNLKILSQDLYKKSATNSSGISTGGAGSAGVNPGIANLSRASVTLSGDRKSPQKSSTLRHSFGGLNPAEIAAGSITVGNAVGFANSIPGAPARRQSIDLSQTTIPSGVLNHPADYFTAESLYDRMKLYAQQGGIPMDYMDRYAARSSVGHQGQNETDDGLHA